MAALVPGTVSGVEQAVMGLVAGLGHLTDGDERYLVVTDPAAPDWLDSYFGPNTQTLIAGMENPRRSTAKHTLTPLLPTLRRARTVGLRLAPLPSVRKRAIAPENPILEAAEPDVVHFPYQWMHRTRAPSLFNPWDLQHLHLPNLFDKSTLAYRHTMYPLWCAACTRVEVASHSVKEDLVERLSVPRQKVMVVQRGAPTTLLAPVTAYDVQAVRLAYDLPRSFAFYPAHSWPHKNHLRLFEALAIARDRYSLDLKLVLTGQQTDFWPTLQAAIEDLALEDRVTSLGFVEGQHVRSLYHAAQFTVFPSLFEGAGFPVAEALTEGSPLLCSRLPVLTEQAGDAALFFDPYSPEDIARAMLQVWGNREEQTRLRTAGSKRTDLYSWDRAARIYRAAYRQLAGRELTAEDQELLTMALDAG